MPSFGHGMTNTHMNSQQCGHLKRSSQLYLGSEKNSFLRIWPLQVLLCAGGWLHPIYLWTVLSGFNGISPKKDVKVEGACWEVYKMVHYINVWNSQN